MAISSFKGSSGASQSNDFTLSVGAGADTTYVLDRAYAAGTYNLSFENNDLTYDIYLVGEDGSLAGYTNSETLSASVPFNKVVVLNAAANEIVYFSYQGAAITATSDGDQTVAGAFVDSVGTQSLPNINDTTVVYGGNFAEDVAVSFIGQNLSELGAKGVVRSSSTELIVTRPDSLTVNNSPYTLKVANPGIPVPSGSNAHLLSNGVTAGTNPTWITSGTQYYIIDGPTSVTLQAQDSESPVTYSLVSGTLPAGLSLNSTTGVISGTFSGTASEGSSVSLTFRATDEGGNFLDRTFSFVANALPAWITPAGAITDPTIQQPYSFQLQASGGTVGSTLTYSLVAGSLLTGHTLSSTGLISGTATDAYGTTATFTVRVTDNLGNYSEREFSTTIGGILATGGTTATSGGYAYHTFTSSGTFSLVGAPANAQFEVLTVAGGGGGGNNYDAPNNIFERGGGGGAGGAKVHTVTLTPGNYAVAVGAGGGNMANGSTSQLGNVASTTGGGRGGQSRNTGPSGGGSGGGGYGWFDYWVGTGSSGGAGGIAGEGNSGASGYAGWNGSYANYGGGGGGGAGAAAGGASGGTGLQLTTWASATSTGVSNYYAGGGAASGGSAGAGNGAANTGGGGNVGGGGQSGLVIVRYQV